MSDQRCFNVVNHHLNNVDPTLKMKQISEVRFSVLHNIDTTSVSTVEINVTQRQSNRFWTLRNIASTSRLYDIISTLF